MKTKTHIKQGSRRIKKDKKLYVLEENNNWMLDSDIDENIEEIIRLYEENQNLNSIIDTNHTDFLKGYLDPSKKILGQRIKHLPNGKELARGGFSLYAKNLKINLSNKVLWDVCYQNSSGTYTYLYNIDKVNLEKEKKSQIVDLFDKNYNLILSRLEEDIKNTNSINYIALYILLKTKIRVGNIDYYNLHKHQGLTTLKKYNLTIYYNAIEFNFIGKDGIPQHFVEEFDRFILDPLSKHLQKLKKDDFVFTKSNHLIHSSDFSKILFKYTKIHFYPHIIRSHFADQECKNFLKNNKSSTKKQINDFILTISKKLGHKKFNKKNNKYEPCSKITIESYIRPKLYEKLLSIIIS